MVASTDILQFAGGGGANVISQAAYAALSGLLANGFQTGTALSDQLNKVWRQSSFMAAGLAAWMVQRGVSVPDDGNLANLVGEITQALTTFISNTFESLSLYQQAVTLSQTTANNSTYVLATQTVTFPSTLAPCQYRVKGHSVLAGLTVVDFSLLNNFRLSMSDGTNIVYGAPWLINTVGAAGPVEIALESYFALGVLYAPGSTVTFTFFVSTLGGGGHTGQMAMTSVLTKLQVENA